MATRLAVVPVLAAALAAAGCGTGGMAHKQADQANGKKLFVQQCSACHTLAAAGTQGRIGPDLDAAFASSRAQGFKETTFRNVVLEQIRIAIPPMPANLVTGQNAQDVAAYIAAVAGTAGPTATTVGGGATAAGAGGKQVFASAGCGSCHTLKDAGSSGKVGPNLDNLKPDAARVARHVTNGGVAMPSFKGKLTPQQIQAVAKYVSSVAGK